jgi:hypothetical protein
MYMRVPDSSQAAQEQQKAAGVVPVNLVWEQPEQQQQQQPNESQQQSKTSAGKGWSDEPALSTATGTPGGFTRANAQHNRNTGTSSTSSSSSTSTTQGRAGSAVDNGDGSSKATTTSAVVQQALAWIDQHIMNRWEPDLTPPWATWPDYDRVENINILLQGLWPHLAPAVTELLLEQVGACIQWGMEL